MMQLNEKQKEVVDHFDGPCLVTSVPGSGKTFSIVERTIRLIERGIKPENILCITFTNKASKEMEQRIFTRLGKKVKMFIGTFHGFCARLLRAWGSEIGYDSTFNILDDSDQKEMLEKIMRQLSYDKKSDKINIYDIMSYMNKSRENLLSIHDIIFDSKRKAYKDIIEQYFNQTRESNMIDFSGLLYETVRLLEEKEHILNKLRDLFTYIQVDEVQDTNYAQFHIINMIGGEKYNIMLMGDISQSVYLFRGARYQNIYDFLSLHPNCKKITLGKNYRSTPQIIEKADNLIKKNVSHMADFFETDNPDGKPVRCERYIDSNTEAYGIGDKIKYYVQELGWDYSDIAVFYRLNKLSLELQTSFSNMNIPFVVIGGQNFFARREIKDVIAMLRFVGNQKDLLAFHRVMNLFKGVGGKSIGKIENLAKEHQKSILSICRDIEEYSNRVSIINAAKNFYAVFVEAVQIKQPDKCLIYLVDKLKYKEYLDKTCKDASDAQTRNDNVEELLINASEYVKNEKSSTIQNYLQSIQLASSNDKSNDNDAVTLMTIHASKGLEFPIVFIIGLEEDIMPHKMALADAFTKEEKQEVLEEERRICYVGMTRAKKYLNMSFCTYRKIRTKSGFHNVTVKPSRFLYEAELIKNE